MKALYSPPLNRYFLRSLFFLTTICCIQFAFAQIVVTPPADISIDCAASTAPANTGGSATATGGCASTMPWINEFHYDNANPDAGIDVGEFVEVAGPAGFDLTGWTIVLYNGSGGAAYDTDALPTTIDDEGNGYGAVHITYATNGVQNGAPDGIALVAPGSVLVQFISYEGTFTGVGGAAGGVLSVDVGVSETGTTPIGFSIQKIGTGNMSSDFTWQAPADDSPGSLNVGQTMTDETISFSDEIVDGGCPGFNLIIRTWHAADDCGNMATATQHIQLLDTTLPTFDCPGDFTVAFMGSVDPEDTDDPPTNFADDCGNEFVVYHIDPKGVESNCPDAPDRLTRTWYVEDECGNYSTCTQYLYLECPPPPTCDLICPPDPPTIEWPPFFPTGQVPPNQPQHPSLSPGPPGNYGFPNLMGDCPPSGPPSFADTLTMVMNCPNQVWKLERTWIVLTLGGPETCVQTFWFSDNTDPNIMCPLPISVEWGDPIPVQPPTVTDNCFVNNVTFSDETTLTGSCPVVMIVTRTWRAEDNCQNSASCTQTIYVTDTTPPVITCPTDINDPATATDNCGVPDLTYSDEVINDCPLFVLTVRTWYATDICVLVSTCTQYLYEPCDPVDCVVSEWSEWSACSETCGGGLRCRTRTIITPAMNGGLACPPLEECEPCNVTPCPPPEAVCGVITVYENQAVPDWNGGGVKKIWKIEAGQLDAGSTSVDDEEDITITVKRYLSNITFDWTLTGCPDDGASGGALTNEDKGLVYKECYPAIPGNFNVNKLYKLRIDDDYGFDECAGTIKLLNSPVYFTPSIHFVIPSDGSYISVDKEAIFEETPPAGPSPALVNDLVVLPNPGSNTMQVNWTATTDGEVEIRIADMSGRLAVAQKYEVLSGENKIVFDMSSQAYGVYVVFVQTGTELLSEKWVKE